MAATDERTVLYRFFRADDQLLYVGITSRAGRRWEDHMRSQPWWPEVARQTSEWHPSREAAEAAERAAIKAERPLYNVLHSVGLDSLKLTESWRCRVCQWETTDPAKQIEHMEQEMAKIVATGSVGSFQAERFTRAMEAAANALVRAEASMARANAVFEHAPRPTPRRRRRTAVRKAATSWSSEDVEKLLNDLGQIIGRDRVLLKDMLPLLRSHDPEFQPYGKLTCRGLFALLKDAGIRVTNTANIPRLDPADLRAGRANAA